MRKIELTALEIKIIKLICKQMTAKEISEKVGLKFRTVQDYTMKLQRKLKVKNVVGLVLYAVRNGIVK